MASILVVDDEPSIRVTLNAFLKGQGHQVVLAEDASVALGLLSGQRFDLVITDIVLPRMSGMELLHLIRERDIFVKVIVMTGEPTVDTAAQAVREGACDYLTKPVGKEAMLKAVATACQIKQLEDEKRALEADNRAYQQDLERLVEERSRKLRRAMEDLGAAMKDTIAAMASAVEMRDPYTAGHQERVATLARAIAVELKTDPEVVNGVYYAGLVHDIGKLGVPSEILAYPGRLSEEAMVMIRRHAELGYRILKQVRFPWPVAESVWQHHERLDGTGYPRGLTAPDIIPEARILMVADVVEAMSGHRPYREALGIEASLDEIQRQAGTTLHAESVGACLRLFREQGFLFPDPRPFSMLGP